MSYNPANPNGQATSANSSPVVIASDQSAVPVSGSIGVSGSVTIAANSSVNVTQLGGTAVDTNSGGKSAGTQRVVIATDQPQLTNALKVDLSGTSANATAIKVDGSAANQPVKGTTASGASLTDAPVAIGGLAKTAQPTAVTDGQAVNALHDKLGKRVVVGSLREMKVQQFTTITSSTGETTVLTAVASTFLDVYGVIVANTSSGGCEVTFKDATSGTLRFSIYVPANDTRGFMLPESAAHSQSAVNNNWTATCGSSVASIKITILAVKNI